MLTTGTKRKQIQNRHSNQKDNASKSIYPQPMLTNPTKSLLNVDKVLEKKLLLEATPLPIRYNLIRPRLYA